MLDRVRYLESPVCFKQRTFHLFLTQPAQESRSRPAPRFAS